MDTQEVALCKPRLLTVNVSKAPRSIVVDERELLVDERELLAVAKAVTMLPGSDRVQFLVDRLRKEVNGAVSRLEAMCARQEWLAKKCEDQLLNALTQLRVNVPVELQTVVPAHALLPPAGMSRGSVKAQMRLQHAKLERDAILLIDEAIRCKWLKGCSRTEKHFQSLVAKARKVAV